MPDFYQDLLSEIGAPATPENLRFLQAWGRAEGSRAENNPLATTKHGYQGRSVNSAGVKAYPTHAAGVRATADTLRLPAYQPILAGLTGGQATAQDLAGRVSQSPWGTGQGILKVLNAMVPAAQASTETMDVRLPNGMIVRGVPRGTTRAQLAEKLTRNGYHVPPEWMGQNLTSALVHQRQAPRFAEKPPSASAQIAAPIQRYPQAVREEFQQGTESVNRGIQELSQGPKPGMRGLPQLGPVWNIITGALQQATSPVQGAIRSFLSEPLQATTGIPRAYPEIAANLALPGLGPARAAREVEPIAEVMARGWRTPAREAMAPAATARVERARNLPVPTELTRGQATRDPVQLRMETQASRLASGTPLAERYVEQNRALLQSLDVLKGRTRATARTKEDVGRVVVDQRLKSLERASDERVNAMYEHARRSGEMQAPVNVDALTDYYNAHPDPEQVSYIRNKLRALRALAKDEDGNIAASRPLTLEEVEGVRKAAVAAGKAGGTRSHYASEVKGLIGDMTEGAGGEQYRAARQAFVQHKRTFDDPEVVRDILGRTREGERRTALEDVWRRVVSRGSLEDLRRVKGLLLRGPGMRAGIAAWREIQGQTIASLKAAATRTATLDEAGHPELSVAKLKQAYDAIGEDKLQVILGRKTAGELRNVLLSAQDIKTLPPRRIQGSDTVVNALSILERFERHLPFAHLRGLAMWARDLGRQGRAARDVQKALTLPDRMAREAEMMQELARERMSRARGALLGAPIAASRRDDSADHSTLIHQLSRALANPYGPSDPSP